MPKRAVVERSRRELSLDVSVGVHVLLVVEQSSLESQSRGCAKTPILTVSQWFIRSVEDSARLVWARILPLGHPKGSRNGTTVDDSLRKRVKTKRDHRRQPVRPRVSFRRATGGGAVKFRSKITTVGNFNEITKPLGLLPLSESCQTFGRSADGATSSTAM